MAVAMTQLFRAEWVGGSALGLCCFVTEWLFFSLPVKPWLSDCCFATPSLSLPFPYCRSLSILRRGNCAWGSQSAPASLHGPYSTAPTPPHPNPHPSQSLVLSISFFAVRGSLAKMSQLQWCVFLPQRLLPVVRVLITLRNSCFFFFPEMGFCGMHSASDCAFFCLCHPRFLWWFPFSSLFQPTVYIRFHSSVFLPLYTFLNVPLLLRCCIIIVSFPDCFHIPSLSTRWEAVGLSRHHSVFPQGEILKTTHPLRESRTLEWIWQWPAWFVWDKGPESAPLFKL